MRIERHSPEAYTKLQALKNSLSSAESAQSTPPKQQPPKTKNERKRKSPSTRAQKRSKTRTPPSRPPRPRQTTRVMGPARRLLSLSDLTPEQRAIGDALFARARPRLRGLNAELIEEGLARTVQALDGGPSLNQTFFARLQRNLERTLTPGAASTARRRLETAYGDMAREQREVQRTRDREKQRQPQERDPEAASSPKLPLADLRARTPSRPPLRPPRELLSTLQTTNAATDFAGVLNALEDVFTGLNSAETRGSRIFLNAIANRFALVVPEETRSNAMTTAPLTVRWSDLATLPTTSGLAIFRNRPELVAWDIGLEHCRLALARTDDLDGYLRHDQAVSIAMEELTPHRPSGSQLSRLIAGVCAGLDDPHVENYPLSVDHSLRTHRYWSDQHLQRMKRPDAHRVREHLRRLPSGNVTVVREHSRYGDVRWQDGDIRVRLLPHTK